MTPELLYERKATPDGGADETKAAARLSADKPRPPSSLHDADSPPNTSELRPPPIDRDIDGNIDRNTQLKHRDHQQVTSSIAVHGPPSSEWNVGPGNHVRRPPPTRPPPTPPPSTTGFTTRQSPPPPAPPTSAQPKQGDSVPQHFKAPPEPQGAPSVENAEVALRDPTVPPPSVAGSIHEEPLGDALDGTSGEQQAASTNTPASAAPGAILDGGDRHAPPRSLAAQRRRRSRESPEKLDHDQRSGEAGAPRDERPPLHSGEVAPRRSAAAEQQPVVDVDTVKALEWMLKNMSAAAKAATTTTTTTAAPAPVREDNGLRHRVLASKTMHAGGNPDEEERAIAAELKRLHTDMQQMETELKELQAAEPKPSFRSRSRNELEFDPQRSHGRSSLPATPCQRPEAVVDEQPRFPARRHPAAQQRRPLVGLRPVGRVHLRQATAHSARCSGKSYERESCVGGRACPGSTSAPASTANLRIERKPAFSAATTTRVPRINARPFHLWTSARPSDRSDLFYPNPLPQPQFHHHKRW
ncbi:hypothetical protein M3Y99_00896800 [Aphelenchoides fujianensis]|nr:hypothetical protein M3Y99_00896800 [Aphelenchoides fujianensis]